MTFLDAIRYLTGVAMLVGSTRSLLTSPAAFAKFGLPKPPHWLHLFFLAWGILAFALPTDVYIKLCLPLIFLAGYFGRRWALPPARSAIPSS